jgi:hypothetical protein
LDPSLLQPQQGERAGRFGSSLEKFTHPDLPGKIIYYNPETSKYATDPKSLRLLAPGQVAWELTKRGLGAAGKGLGTAVKHPLRTAAAVTVAGGGGAIGAEELGLADVPIYQKGDVGRAMGTVGNIVDTWRASRDLSAAQETVRNFPTIKNPTPEQIAAHRDAKEYIAKMTAPPQGSAPTPSRTTPQQTPPPAATPPTSSSSASPPPASGNRERIRSFEESADLQHLKRLIQYGRH